MTSGILDSRSSVVPSPSAPVGRWMRAVDRWAFPILSVLGATGVLIIAVAFAGARENRGWADAALWVGMLVIVLPVALRLLGRSASRVERLGLVILLGLTLYAVPVLLSPTQFVLHDELGAYRTVADILRSGLLYKPVNPVDPAYSAYPGIGSATAALSRLSGLGIVPCGLILIGIAKVLTMGGLFLFVERCMKSSRVAGIAVVLYAANPNFVYFDAQFAYESLALGLGAIALWMMVRAADANGRWRDAVLSAGFECGTVLTHHLTSYAVAIMSLVWAAALILRGHRRAARRLVMLAVFSTAAAGAYLGMHLLATQNDIGGSIVRSFHGLYQVLSGASNGRKPFTAAGGYSNPPLEKLAGVMSVALLLLAWPAGLALSWRPGRTDAPRVILGLVALLYPASLALRLTAGGAETSNRTSEFVFVGLGAAIALVIAAVLGRWLDRSRWSSSLGRALIIVYIGIVFAGGITVGVPLGDMLPGDYLVGADNRSIDTEGVAAAHWAARWLPPGARFLADVADGELLSAYTQLDSQSGFVGKVAIGELFVSPVFGPEERHIIAFDKLQYLVVDRRDSTALPHSGGYFGGSDPKRYSAPISLAALRKFNDVPCIDRIFSSGNVAIYFSGRVVTGCR